MEFDQIKVAIEMLEEKRGTLYLQKTRRECKRILQALIKVCGDYKKELNQMIRDDMDRNPKSNNFKKNNLVEE